MTHAPFVSGKNFDNFQWARGTFESSSHFATSGSSSSSVVVHTSHNQVPDLHVLHDYISNEVLQDRMFSVLNYAINVYSIECSQ